MTFKGVNLMRKKLLTNVNPDFYRTTLREPKGSAYPKRTVIYSTLDHLIVGRAPGASEYVNQIHERNHNLTLYALNLTLATKIHIPGGDINIFCKTLYIPEGGYDEDAKQEIPGAIIDVSPEILQPIYQQPLPVTPLKLKTNPPTKGAHGDAIAALINEGKPEAKNYTQLPMADENGLPIEYYFSQPGQAGGSIRIICSKIILAGKLQLNAEGGRGYAGVDGQQGGPGAAQGGRGGDAGKGGIGGAGGSIRVHYAEIAKQEQQQRIEMNIDPGKPGCSGAPGVGGVPAGVGGAKVGSIASGKDDGNIDFNDELDLSELGEASDEIFLLKVLQKAKLMYLFNQPTQFTGTKIKFPSNWKALGELLRWLYDVLHRYVSPDKGDSSAQRKKALRSQAGALLTYHQKNKTYFGMRPNWIPSLPIDKMLSTFKSAQKKSTSVRKTFFDN